MKIKIQLFVHIWKNVSNDQFKIIFLKYSDQSVNNIFNLNLIIFGIIETLNIIKQLDRIKMDDIKTNFTKVLFHFFVHLFIYFFICCESFATFSFLIFSTFHLFRFLKQNQDQDKEDSCLVEQHTKDVTRWKQTK